MDSWVLTPYPPAVAPPTSPTFLTSSWLQTREWARGRPADKARSGASPTSSPQNHLEEKNGYCSKPFSLGDLWHSKKLIHLLAVWFWASHLISLNLYHFTGKMEIVFILQMGVKQRHSKCSVKWVLLPITPWSCLRYVTLCPYSLSPSTDLLGSSSPQKASPPARSSFLAWFPLWAIALGELARVWDFVIKQTRLNSWSVLHFQPFLSHAHFTIW